VDEPTDRRGDGQESVDHLALGTRAISPCTRGSASSC
jgi:hypothetical protein